MSVEDWARREAERRHGVGAQGLEGRMGFQDGAVHAFSALLSDETWDFLSEWNDEEDESLTRAQAIRLVRAAIDAATEGDTE